MEQKTDYIYLASQAQEKFKAAGFDIALDNISIGRIYPEEEPREAGFVVFFAELPEDGTESCIIYVKAFSGKTPRVAHIISKNKTKVRNYGVNNTFRAIDKTEWRYAKTEDGKDYEIITEEFYRNRQRIVETASKNAE